MLRILPVAAVALVAWTGGATASDCLTLVDNLSVEYDLPAAMSLADATTAADDSQALNARRIEGEGTVTRTTPAGRPGLAQLTNPSGPAPTFGEHSRLSTSQRNQVQDFLHSARAAEAIGNEEECMAFLKQAQGVVASPPTATSAKPRGKRGDQR
jgi:hypothetical protein